MADVEEVKRAAVVGKLCIQNNHDNDAMHIE